MLIGLTLFRGIQAIDLDKPNTANSDVYFSIIAGNEDGKFVLENGKPAVLTLRKRLDFDAGDHAYQLTVRATVSIIITNSAFSVCNRIDLFRIVARNHC